MKNNNFINKIKTSSLHLNFQLYKIQTNNNKVQMQWKKNNKNITTLNNNINNQKRMIKYIFQINIQNKMTNNKV